MKKTKISPVLIVLALSSVSLVAYQNCSNSASFTAADNLASLVDDSVPIVPQFATKTAGDAESFPPLKLLFVVDNSGTMEINQINLASAFDRMFAGNNATNLAPFETSAYVINTAQFSPDKTNPVFNRLPTKPGEYFATSPFDGYLENRGATYSGLIPGDLAGYGLTTTVANDRTVTSLAAAPVLLFKPGTGGTVVSRFSHKSRNGSVDAFSNDFKERLRVLNPSNSAIDPATQRGILDDVVDKESGLCGVARILKNNQGILNPGDLASIIIVSDENDQDPSGRSCYDSIIEAKSGVNYVDGHCDVAQTSLNFKAEVANPSKAKCKVDFETGFNYDLGYKLPTTDVKYYTKEMTYDQLRTDVTYYTSTQQYEQRRTSVSYFTSKMMYDKIETPVTYYTKSPTYSVPQTNVKYYTEVESCTIRDGVKTNCKYTYPSGTVALEGAFGNQCATFVAGKLPGGALYNKAGYLPECSAGTPVARTGACSANDPTKLNCLQNYSSPMTIRLAGKPASANACDMFVSGRLPSGALTTASTDPGYTPSCGNLITTVDQTGACTVNDTDKTNCRTIYTAAVNPTVLDGIPGANSCNDFARNRLPSGASYGVAGYLPTCSAAPSVAKTGTCSTSNTNVENCRTVYSTPTMLTFNGRVPAGSTCEATFRSKLPSNTVGGSSTYPISCANADSLIGQKGNCTVGDTNIANCKATYTLVAAPRNIEGVPTSTCGTFAQGRLPSGAVYTDAGYEPACSQGTPIDRSVNGSQLHATFRTEMPTVGAACGATITNRIVAERGLLVASGTTPACTVASLVKDSQTLADSAKDVSCAVADWRNVCAGSDSARRNCVPTDIPAGEKYEATAKSMVYEGAFTCDTLCSKTTFCTDKMGTVGDNHYECKVTAANPLVKSNFTMEPESATCKTGEMRVVTKGPYKTTETKATYVAGAKSEANSATALSEMIVERSREIFNTALPIVSVFVRQQGDTLGTSGSLGTEYNRLADMLGGKKLSVLSTADQYASSLQDLSGKIRERLGQSVSFREVGSHQKIRKVWLRTKGAADFTQVQTSLWSASGGTITLSPNLAFTYGDEFKIEYW